jgi:hypothetical protein
LPFRINSAEHKALLQEYLSADPSRKAQMEKRYGKKQLSTMTSNYLSESYKTANAKPCPNCRAPIEKSEGCNKGRNSPIPGVNFGMFFLTCANFSSI